jgi:hypothetical protein
VTAERIWFIFSFHVFTLPLSSDKSVDRTLTAPLCINALRGTRRDHQRDVIAFRSSASVRLSQDPRAIFVTEPFTDCLGAESPEACPIGDCEVCLAKGLLRRSLLLLWIPVHQILRKIWMLQIVRNQLETKLYSLRRNLSSRGSTARVPRENGRVITLWAARLASP